MHKDDRALLYELNKRVARGEKLNKHQMELHEYLANENLTDLRQGNLYRGENMKDYVESIIDAHLRQLNLPGDKGATTYAEYIQKLVLEWSFKASSSLDTELERIQTKFCTSHGGDAKKGFTFAPLEDEVKFPSQVAPQVPKGVLREASNLSSKERAAEITNVNLMDNLLEPQSTQDFVSAVMVKLREDMTIYTPAAEEFQIVSFPSPMAYFQKSFGNRSPDLPFYSRCDNSSPHCITFMLDVKPCEDGDFGDEQVGHIVDMTRELLTTEQTRRTGMICGLTDGSRFQFFRVWRYGADGVKVDASRIFKGQEGWQVLIALMALPLDDPFLMHEEHRVAGLQLRSLLGHGARSTVYKVELDAAEGGDEGGGKDGGRAESEGDGECSSNDRCLPDRSYCKVYTRPPEGELGRGNGWRGFDRERTALLRLQGVPNIPQIHQETSTLPSLQSSALRGCQNKTERVLVLSPVALPLWPWPARNDVVITGRHFAQLVTTVEAMHGAGVLHRDIKPANVFLQEDTDLLLLGDFDAAVALEEVKDAPPPPPPAMQQETNKVQTRSAKLKAAAPEEAFTLEALTLESPALTHPHTPKVWRRDQEFMWVGSVGYSDTRRSGRDSCLHTPTPEHDLVALVRTVYTLYTQKGPGSQRHGGDKDDTDAYWAERMPAASMWQNFLQMARDKDYGALRQALGRL